MLADGSGEEAMLDAELVRDAARCDAEAIPPIDLGLPVAIDRGDLAFPNAPYFRWSRWLWVVPLALLGLPFGAPRIVVGVSIVAALIAHQVAIRRRTRVRIQRLPLHVRGESLRFGLLSRTLHFREIEHVRVHPDRVDVVVGREVLSFGWEADGVHDLSAKIACEQLARLAPMAVERTFPNVLDAIARLALPLDEAARAVVLDAGARAFRNGGLVRHAHLVRALTESPEVRAAMRSAGVSFARVPGDIDTEHDDRAASYREGHVPAKLSLEVERTLLRAMLTARASSSLVTTPLLLLESLIVENVLPDAAWGVDLVGASPFAMGNPDSGAQRRTRLVDVLARRITGVPGFISGTACVTIHDDDITPRSFVEELLHERFDHGPQTASRLAEAIHTQGCAPVATLPSDRAHRLVAEVHEVARAKGFPLRLTVVANE